MKASFVLPLLVLLLTYSKTIEEFGSNYRGLASSWNVIPSRSLAGLYYLFKGHKVDENNGVVKVSGPVVEITGGDNLGAKFYREGYTAEIDEEDFEEEQALAYSVFEATTRTGSNVGTAFLVGNDLVLTNRHVMAYTPEARSWECGKFSVKLNHRDERVDCAKVRYCSSRFDYCVVELNKMISGASVGSEVKPLRLTNNVRNNLDHTMLHIGNAAGLGIQASRGKGLKVKDGEFFHYAPTLIGSSGAPIFNEKLEVVGINWGHTGGNYIDDGSFNRGVLAQTIFEELKSAGYTRILKEVKSFRAWYRRIHLHRHVRINDPKTE